MTKFKAGDKVQAVGTKVQGVITKVISKGYYHVFFGESSGTYQVNVDSIEVYEGDLEAVKNQTFTKKELMKPEDVIVDKYEACWTTLRMTLKMAEEVNPSATTFLNVMDGIEDRMESYFPTVKESEE